MNKATPDRSKPRSGRIYVAFGLALATTVVALVALSWLGGRLPPPESQVKSGGLEFIHYPLWRKASDWIAGRKYILLTFDDGPYGHGVDEKILSVLSRHGAHAIFFEVCSHVTPVSLGVPGKIVATGNLLGNHSYDHANLKQLTGESLAHEVRDCSDRLEATSGVRPKFFRPPWGKTSAAVAEAANQSGMVQVLWNTNSGDTWLDSPRKINDLALDEVDLGGSGSILLMHSKPTTAEALDGLLTEMQRRGFIFVLPKSHLQTAI